MKPSFKLPERQKVDDWVAGTVGSASTTPELKREGEGVLPKVKPARLTIDLPPDIHARFKAACALNSTDMVTEVRAFIEDWTQKHSR
jgi:hypothetical protein